MKALLLLRLFMDKQNKLRMTHNASIFRNSHYSPIYETEPIATFPFTNGFELTISGLKTSGLQAQLGFNVFT